MSSPVIGANIRLARLFHGLSLEDVAEQIGKSRQFVHKVETEQTEPSGPILEAIAKMTQVRAAFFGRAATAPITEEQCHFRKNFTTRAPIKHVALAKGEMFRRLVTGVESHVEFPKNTIPQRDVNSFVEIEQATEACRRHWGLGLGPIQNTIRLAENVGAVVTTFRGVSREVDAYSISAARPIIVVNAEDSSACRLRFDVAHELAHLIMHVGHTTGSRKTESEANRFAGALLLPRSSFVKEFPRLRGSHLNWSGLADMKLRWKASKSALLYRARQLALISEDQYRTGVIRLARGGEARVEKEDHLLEKEQPELFTQAVRLASNHKRQTLEQFANEMDVTRTIFEEFLSSEPSADPTDAGGTVSGHTAAIVSLDAYRSAGRSGERMRG